MKKKYLVTGGAGFIGSCVAKRLLNDGHDVWIIDNFRTGYASNVPDEAIFIQGDCSDKRTIDSLGLEVFDAIFHIAGQSSGEISFEDPVYDINANTVSSILLLDFAVKTNCQRFIFASTMSVYGDIDERAASEDLLACPKSFYAVSKLASEHYLKVFANTRSINFSALRYFNVYGPGQNLENMKQGMASIFLTQLFSDKTPSLVIKGSLDRFRDFIFINDVVDITVCCLNAPEAQNKIINVGTGEKTTVREILKVIMREAEIEKPISIEGSTPGDQFGICADTSLLKSFYKKDLISFNEGMRLFVSDIQQRK